MNKTNSYTKGVLIVRTSECAKDMELSPLEDQTYEELLAAASHASYERCLLTLKSQLHCFLDEVLTYSLHSGESINGFCT